MKPIFTAALLALAVVGLRNRCTVIQENMAIGYSDDRFAETTAGVYQFNETTRALNFTCLLKVELPKWTKVFIKGLRLVNTDHQLQAFRLEKTFKENTEMELFDGQDLFLKYCKPPAIWPLENNVSYHVLGWNPDCHKLPPSFSIGKWKFEISTVFPNGTRFLELNLFF